MIVTKMIITMGDVIRFRSLFFYLDWEDVIRQGFS